MLTQTTSGSDDPTEDAQPRDGGHTFALATSDIPDAPGRPVATVRDEPQGQFAVMLSWQPSSDASVAVYEIYDVHSGELFAFTEMPEILLTELEADVVYNLAVAAVNSEEMTSAESAAVMFHRDEAVGVVAGGPQTLHYVPPLYSWHEPYGWSISLPGADFKGVTIEVTQGGVTVSAIPIFVSAGQVNAIMPSDAPLGRVSVRITFGGGQSNPASLTIVANSVGIFTATGTGIGPGIFQNFVSQSVQALNSAFSTAKPGQVVTMWATGLGPIDGNDSQAPPVGTLPFNVEIFVGGRPVTKVLYAGRAPYFGARTGARCWEGRETKKRRSWPSCNGDETALGRREVCRTTGEKS